jgi:dynein heavy chain
MEEWAKFQIRWKYLQPIFDSPDIFEQLPNETKKFSTIDMFYKQLMNSSRGQTNTVLRTTVQEGLYERFSEANRSLEIIQNELRNYLEKKREKFGRFYFLSNEDLIEILSLTKDPTSVQPHLKKIFENIYLIEFEKDLRIIGINSKEGEVIALRNPISTTARNVEDWIQDMELEMRVAVRYELEQALIDFH